MGLLEAIVVVYLRELYYPHGFGFGMGSMPTQMLGVEWLREIATIVMLAAVARIASSGAPASFAYFVYCFGVWDLCYYAGLKLLIDWPPSLLTWDLLFLIPVPWVGPVLAPLLCSLTMILLGRSLLHLKGRSGDATIRVWEQILILAGALAIFATHIWDYSALIIRGGHLSRLSELARDPRLQQDFSQYRPSAYNWPLFALGEALLLLAAILILRRASLRTKLSRPTNSVHSTKDCPYGQRNTQ